MKNIFFVTAKNEKGKRTLLTGGLDRETATQIYCSILPAYSPSFHSLKGMVKILPHIALHTHRSVVDKAYDSIMDAIYGSV